MVIFEISKVAIIGSGAIFHEKNMMSWKGNGYLFKSLTSMRSDEDDVIENQNEGGVYRREDHDDDDDDDGEICGYSNYHYK